MHLSKRDVRCNTYISKRDVRCNTYMRYLLNENKGYRRMYDVMVPTKLIKESSTWEQDTGYISAAEMKAYNTIILILKDIIFRGLSI